MEEGRRIKRNLLNLMLHCLFVSLLHLYFMLVKNLSLTHFYFYYFTLQYNVVIWQAFYTALAATLVLVSLLIRLVKSLFILLPFIHRIDFVIVKLHLGGKVVKDKQSIKQLRSFNGIG